FASLMRPLTMEPFIRGIGVTVALSPATTRAKSITLVGAGDLDDSPKYPSRCACSEYWPIGRFLNSKLPSVSVVTVDDAGRAPLAPPRAPDAVGFASIGVSVTCAPAIPSEVPHRITVP